MLELAKKTEKEQPALWASEVGERPGELPSGEPQGNHGQHSDATRRSGETRRKRLVGSASGQSGDSRVTEDTALRLG